MAKERSRTRMKKTQMRPATDEEIMRFKGETGIANLDEDPPGTEKMTFGQWVDEVFELRRLSHRAR